MKSTALTKPRSNVVSDLNDRSMQTERVDKVSSLLLSLIVLVGLSVVGLGILFSIGNAVVEERKNPQPMDVGQGGDGKIFEKGLDVPTNEEVEQLNEPTAEQAIVMATEVISNVAGSFEGIESETNANSSGDGGHGKRNAGADGKGSGSGGTPRNERWMLKFTACDKRNYARQLESFKIKIGAIGGGIATVDSLANVASAPTRNSGASKDFRGVLYFASTNSNVLEQYEKQILQAAGVPVDGRQILKFIPDETEELLAQAEAEFYLANRSKDLRIAEVVKTVFECRLKKDGVGYEFVVIDQRYLGTHLALK